MRDYGRSIFRDRAWGGDMYRDSLAAAVRRQATPRYRASIALLLALVFFASVISAELRFPGASTAPWWPAAGISVIAVFAARGRGVAVAGLIVAVTTAANLVAGTIWWVAIGFGIANAAEAWLVPAITRYGRPPGHRFRHPDAGQYIIATAGGAAASGLLVGLVVALNGGDLLDTAAHVAASHGSSVLLLGVLALIPRSSFIPKRAVELILQSALLAVAVGVAFGPGQYFPVTFLVIPVMAWAAFRFTAGVTLIQITLVSVSVTVLSVLDGGAFAAVADGDAAVLIGLIQLFTLSLGISLLPLAVAQDDRNDLYLRLSAREQLLRGAIVSSHAGFIVVRREEGGAHRIVESNPNGERMLAPWLTTDGGRTLVDGSRLAELADSAGDDTMTDVAFPDGRHLEVSAKVVAADETLLLIQAIDVTEQTKAARALADAFVHEREAADRLRALAAQKDEFVSSVSHELRTPVTSILGYAEDLADADLPDDERHSVDVIARNARRLADLVEDLLNASREAGQSGAEASAVDLHAAIGQCVEDLSAIAERAHVTVDLVEGDRHVVAADRLGLDRVLVNLLANAIKFTPPGGRIDITTAVTGSFARTEIADTGRGIPPNEVDKVFERFYRVTANNEFVPGTGLGLPIVRDLVTRMGGRVELRSDGTTGTTAIVELPLFREADLTAGATLR
jgi:two-component system phosphate regulon sensor histidine kinase PhoR